MLLLQHDGLWSALDRWLVELDADTFTAQLPLIRRAFADFEAPERRAMGEKVKRMSAGGATAHDDLARAGAPAVDHERAALVLPVLHAILGAQRNAN